MSETAKILPLDEELSSEEYTLIAGKPESKRTKEERRKITNKVKKQLSAVKAGAQETILSEEEVKAQVGLMKSMKAR
ncbi:hypothetical protein K9M59_01745 [Candidatus Gracilibacteria bacterium]|nr:hypothetical protein [Candidatus Gracilibacteria bacterium]MCF7819741.1 hypothetical protein [Candidatus Gracilibacteria bacterium]